MKNKRSIGVVGLVMVALALLACEAGSLVAMINPPTATPTRTLRPTFTPRPAATETPEDTATPEATETLAESPTLTRRPTARPATPKPAGTATPAPPQFAWHQDPNVDIQGWCDAGPSVYEVKGRIMSGGKYAPAIHVVVLDRNGSMVAQMDSLFEEQMNLEEHVNCREVRNRFNYQLDVSAARFSGPLTLRLTKSAADLTPISTDIKFDVNENGGRWYYNFSK